METYRLPNGNLSHHLAHLDDVAALGEVELIALVVAVDAEALDSHTGNIINIKVLSRRSGDMKHAARHRDVDQGEDLLHNLYAALGTHGLRHPEE